MAVIASGGGGGGVSGLTAADGGTAIADNAAVRGDGGTSIQGSLVEIDDAGNVTFPARALGKQGADVPTATTITLGGGNFFRLTGTTTIDNINATGWTSGSIVYLRATSAVLVRHATAGPEASIALRSSANVTLGAGDILGLLYDGDAETWVQVGHEDI